MVPRYELGIVEQVPVHLPVPALDGAIRHITFCQAPYLVRSPWHYGRMNDTKTGLVQISMRLYILDKSRTMWKADVEHVYLGRFIARLFIPSVHLIAGQTENVVQRLPYLAHPYH